MKIDGIKLTKLNPFAKEDLVNIEPEIKDVDMYADDWVEQAAEKTNAVEDDTYVKLKHGVLTVDQIDALLDSIPIEMSYIDQNNQFLYYNNKNTPEDMIAPSHEENVGKPLGKLHPEKIGKFVKLLVKQLRDGDAFHATISQNKGKSFVVHNYKRIQSREGKYMGINEFVYDLKPLVDYYLKKTGTKLVNKKAKVATEDVYEIDSISSASKKGEETAEDLDGVSSASKS